MKLLHSHNDYWAPYPLYSGLPLDVNMFEADIIYLNGKLMLSHSWRPFEFLCFGELEENYLLPMRMYVTAHPEKELWLYIEYKTSNKNVNSVLLELLLKNRHPNLHITLSALNNTWYQKPRHIQAQKFMDSYQKEFNLTWEADLEKQYEYEKVDLYEKKWWMF
jgi:hypothetical protein